MESCVGEGEGEMEPCIGEGGRGDELCTGERGERQRRGSSSSLWTQLQAFSYRLCQSHTYNSQQIVMYQPTHAGYYQRLL
jgi:hypothetical protein